MYLTLLTYLRMESYITHMNTYLTYLPTFPYLMVYSAIVKKKKKKEKKRVKRDVVDFAL